MSKQAKDYIVPYFMQYPVLVEDRMEDEARELGHEQKTAMLYRAVFGERDPQTLKRTWGLQDMQRAQLWLLGILVAHSFGVPTDKILQFVAHSFSAAQGIAMWPHYHP